MVQGLKKTKVSLVSSKDYGDESRTAARLAIEMLGGIENIVRPDDVVLIKPNLVIASNGESGNITHSSLVQELIRLCHDAGASKIFVGDGSGNTETRKAIVSSGMKKIINKLASKGVPVEFVDLNYDRNPETNKFDVVSITDSSEERVYRIAHTPLISDVIISVPKMKSHNGTGITVALKNMIGLAPGEYYGFPKKKGRIEALPHTSLEYSDNPEDPLAMYNVIVRTIIDLNKIALGLYPGSPKRRRYLAVVDGVVAGAYDYIFSTFEVPLWKPVRVGAVIASTDPVAIDTVASRIMCYLPEKIPMIVKAQKMGLGQMKNLEVLGEQVEDIRKFVPPADNWLGIVDLELPNTEWHMLSEGLVRHTYNVLSRMHLIRFIKLAFNKRRVVLV